MLQKVCGWSFPAAIYFFGELTLWIRQQRDPAASSRSLHTLSPSLSPSLCPSPTLLAWSPPGQIKDDLELCLEDIRAVKKSIKNAKRRIKDLVEFRKASRVPLSHHVQSTPTGL